MNPENGKAKAVYSITESKGKSYWTKVGVAFVNKDGSMNVNLTAFPVDGKLHIREFSSKTEAPADNSGDQNPAENLPF